jgi:MYXO-CTERM domain-containing protein
MTAINTIRIGILAAAMMAGPMWAQDSADNPNAPKPAEKTVSTAGGPQSGSPGSELPNRSAPGQTASTNSTLQQDKDGDMGINLGWLGLLGLAGLFGLRRGATRSDTVDAHDMHRSPSPGMSRS